MRLSLFLTFVAAACLLATTTTHAQLVNPLPGQIRNGRRTVEIKRFAQLPPQNNGRPAHIVSMTNRGRSLYVVDAYAFMIYRVDPQGRAWKWFNVSKGVQRSTGGKRDVNLDTRIYGGVRSIAFHPNFYRNGLFYISMMEDIPDDEENFEYLSKAFGGRQTATADSVVAEFYYNRTTKRVDLNSYRQVIRVGLPRLEHPIRQMVFMGNNLVIGHGDGSQSYKVLTDIVGGGQRNDALGKIIRINPLRSGSRPYTIPNGNPWRVNNRYLPELYAVGVRNPHNLCYSRRYGLFVADVGRNNIEEINLIKSGKNYGWAEREGTFVHLSRGGVVTGLRELPANDSAYGYTYPVAMYGHEGTEGQGTTFHAIAGSCPVENRSPFRGMYLYANFPGEGEIYYSFVQQMLNAVTEGNPADLTQAKTFRARVSYDHDGDDSTPSIAMANFREIVRRDAGDNSIERADIRFGRGLGGEIYISSKANGHVYIIKSTVEA